MDEAFAIPPKLTEAERFLQDYTADRYIGSVARLARLGDWFRDRSFSGHILIKAGGRKVLCGERLVYLTDHTFCLAMTGLDDYTGYPGHKGKVITNAVFSALRDILPFREFLPQVFKDCTQNPFSVQDFHEFSYCLAVPLGGREFPKEAVYYIDCNQFHLRPTYDIQFT